MFLLTMHVAAAFRTTFQRDVDVICAGYAQVLHLMGCYEEVAGKAL